MFNFHCSLRSTTSGLSLKISEKRVHPSKVVGDYETNFSNGRVNLESTIASARPFGVIATVTLASFNTDIRYSSDFHLVNAGQ